MHEIKTGPGRPTFWCGILTGEKQSATPSQARTVRGPYTAFNLANSQRDKIGGPAGEGSADGKGGEKD
jgi:hypothetical protein